MFVFSGLGSWTPHVGTFNAYSAPDLSGIVPIYPFYYYAVVRKSHTLHYFALLYTQLYLPGYLTYFTLHPTLPSRLPYVLYFTVLYLT
jgi:hypothetical protein